MKIILVILLAIFAAIQFMAPAKNNTEYNKDVLKNDISTLYLIPENIKSLLKVSCYDCHSNNTLYPWYSSIQPIGWWMQLHIDEGKRELNFTEFALYNKEKRKEKLKEMIHEIKANKMPLPSYLKMHKEAKLTQNAKVMVVAWISSVLEKE